MLDQNNLNIIMIKFKKEKLDWAINFMQVGYENKIRPEPCSIHLNKE